MNSTGNNKQRPGPIGFHGERSVTSFPKNGQLNSGGIGEASLPTNETPAGSHELKVRGPLVWGIVSGILIAVGVLLLSPIAIGGGFLGVVCSFLVHRRNLTEVRLRDNFFGGVSQ